MAEIDINGGVAATTLSGGINSGDTTINLTDASSYPPGTTNFFIVIDRGEASEEVVEISGRSSNTLTVAGSGRGADGTSATSHASGATVEHCVPASALQEANTHANQETGTPHGSAYVTPSGNVATATALETARNIGGVGFNGTDDINLPGVNIAGTQDTSGNAATASALNATAFSTFTPTLSQSGTVALSNDSAWYLQIGSLVIAFYRLTVSGTGSAGSNVELSLPVAAAGLRQISGALHVDDQSGAGYIAHPTGGSSTSVVSLLIDSGDPLGSGSFALASGDVILGHAIYEAA